MSTPSLVQHNIIPEMRPRVPPCLIPHTGLENGNGSATVRGMTVPFLDTFVYNLFCIGPIVKRHYASMAWRRSGFNSP